LAQKTFTDSVEYMEGQTSGFKMFFINHRRLFFILVPIILVIGVAATFWFVTKPAPADDNTVVTPKKKSQTTLTASLTNGVMVAEDIANRHPVAVMIENSPAARPQTGLTSADIVYEAVTEGGITRFMGIFSQTYPDKAGPVRSARSYFIDWLSEYDAFYAHAGGSPTALSRIGQYSIKDSANDDAFHREPQAGVASEHTLFADVSKIYNLGTTSHKWAATYDTPSWKFKDATKTFGTVPKVTLNFSSSQFQVVWTHNPITDTYSRVLDSVAHKDAVSGEQITAKTIVVMTVSHSPNAPYAGTGKESEWTMSTIGSGPVSVFEDGTRTDGTWKKPSRLERTRFYDGQGVEIPLNSGKIWIEILPQDGSIVAPSA
jgi:hypothetical protein